MKNTTVQNITDTLELNYMPYAMSVIVSRAIPEIDGFKPAHRKLLYMMYKMGLLNSNRIKSADVVGQTMRLNPHGDSAIYETLVRLTRGNDALLHPFIDSKGNFGKQYSSDMAYAASRYTEVKLAPICNELFADIEKNTVDFVDNYNGSMKEPLLFPVSFPNILVTANQGIAVGMASNICSFNLKEVCDATIAFIKNDNVFKFIKAPDFSTGGEIIYDENEMQKIFETGRGGFKIRARYRFDKKNSCIEIFEIPYTTTIEAIINKIILLVKTNKIRQINDVRDETDLSGLKIAIDVKKNCDHKLLMNNLFYMTPLCDTFSCNFNVLIDGKPQTLGIKKILEYWYEFRFKCVTRRIKFDLENYRRRLHLLNGLQKILLDIDKAIKIIRQTHEEKFVLQNLMDAFDIDKIQAEYVCEIKLRNLNREYLLNKTLEHENLQKTLNELEKTLSDKNKIDKIICDELANVSKKYAQPRRTQIVSEQLSAPQIVDCPIKLILTKQNYCKKILKSNSVQNLKDNDQIISEIDATNTSDIIFFSNQQNVYKLKAHELNFCKAANLGEYMKNYLKLPDNENLIFMTATKDYDGNFIFVFENGKVAKIKAQCYQTKLNRKKLINSYGKNSKLIGIDYIKNDTDYVLIRDGEKAVMFNSKLVATKVTKSSNGIQVFVMKKKSVITKFLRAENFVCDDKEIYRINKIPSAVKKILTDGQINLFEN